MKTFFLTLLCVLGMVGTSSADPYKLMSRAAKASPEKADKLYRNALYEAHTFRDYNALYMAAKRYYDNDFDTSENKLNTLYGYFESVPAIEPQMQSRPGIERMQAECHLLYVLADRFRDYINLCDKTGGMDAPAYVYSQKQAGISPVTVTIDRPTEIRSGKLRAADSLYNNLYFQTAPSDKIVAAFKARNIHHTGKEFEQWSAVLAPAAKERLIEAYEMSNRGNSDFAEQYRKDYPANPIGYFIQAEQMLRDEQNGWISVAGRIYRSGDKEYWRGALDLYDKSLSLGMARKKSFLPYLSYAETIVRSWQKVGYAFGNLDKLSEVSAAIESAPDSLRNKSLYLKVQLLKQALERWPSDSDDQILFGDKFYADGEDACREIREKVQLLIDRQYGNTDEVNNCLDAIAVAEKKLKQYDETKQKKLGIALLYETAEAGSAKAMSSLGYYLMGNDGYAANLQQAFYWMSRAAEAGNSYGMYLLAFAWKNGIGCKEDIDKAIEWCGKAVKAGYEPAKELFDELQRWANTARRGYYISIGDLSRILAEQQEKRLAFNTMICVFSNDKDRTYQEYFNRYVRERKNYSAVMSILSLYVNSLETSEYIWGKFMFRTYPRVVVLTKSGKIAVVPDGRDIDGMSYETFEKRMDALMLK